MTPLRTTSIGWRQAGSVMVMWALIHSIEVTGDALRDVLDPRAE